MVIEFWSSFLQHFLIAPAFVVFQERFDCFSICSNSRVFSFSPDFRVFSLSGGGDGVCRGGLCSFEKWLAFSFVYIRRVAKLLFSNKRNYPIQRAPPFRFVLMFRFIELDVSFFVHGWETKFDCCDHFRRVIDWLFVFFLPFVAIQIKPPLPTRMNSRGKMPRLIASGQEDEDTQHSLLRTLVGNNTFWINQSSNSNWWLTRTFIPFQQTIPDPHGLLRHILFKSFVF